MIKKIFILNLVFFCTAAIGLCFSENELTNIELSKYGESYANESIAERLNRLETDFFGMAQSGDVDSRINMLNHLAGNSRQSAIINPQDNFYPGKKRSAIRNFWDNVTSTFDTTGSMTGFTPSMTNSSYGYSNNMYRNEFLNFMNGYNNNYCPDHNRYHNNNRYFNNRFLNDNNFINSGLNNRYFHNHNNANYHNRVHRHPHGMNGNYPYNRVHRTYYSVPPNVSTRSSVQIIRD